LKKTEVLIWTDFVPCNNH